MKEEGFGSRKIFTPLEEIRMKKAHDQEALGLPSDADAARGFALLKLQNTDCHIVIEALNAWRKRGEEMYNHGRAGRSDIFTEERFGFNRIDKMLRLFKGGPR